MILLIKSTIKEKTKFKQDIQRSNFDNYNDIIFIEKFIKNKN